MKIWMMSKQPETTDMMEITTIMESAREMPDHCWRALLAYLTESGQLHFAGKCRYDVWTPIHCHGDKLAENPLLFNIAEHQLKNPPAIVELSHICPKFQDWNTCEACVRQAFKELKEIIKKLETSCPPDCAKLCSECQVLADEFTKGRQGQIRCKTKG